MALVHIPPLLQALTRGVQQQSVPGSTVAELIEQLDALYPGIGKRLVDGERLRPGLSVFVDGVARREGLECPVSLSSEVYFVPAVAGGV